MKSKFRSIFAAGFCALGFALGGAATAQVQGSAKVSPVLAKFGNGEVVTVEDFGAYVVRRIDLRSLSRSYWGARQIVEEMAMTRALSLEGDRVGEPKIERPEGAEAPRFDDIYGDKVYRRISVACPAFMNAEQARKYYDENPAAFTVPAEVRLARLVLPFDERVDGTPATGWLLAQAQQIASRARPMEDAAKDAERVYKLETQGDIGWVPLSDEIFLMRTIGEASVGDLVGPLREGNFVYLFKVLAKKPSKLMPWDSVANFAATRARQHCTEETKKKVRTELFARFDIKVDQGAIREMFAPPPAAAAPQASSPQVTQ